MEHLIIISSLSPLLDLPEAKEKSNATPFPRSFRLLGVKKRLFSGGEMHKRLFCVSFGQENNRGKVEK